MKSIEQLTALPLDSELTEQDLLELERQVEKTPYKSWWLVNRLVEHPNVSSAFFEKFCFSQLETTVKNPTFLLRVLENPSIISWLSEEQSGTRNANRISLLRHYIHISQRILIYQSNPDYVVANCRFLIRFCFQELKKRCQH